MTGAIFLALDGGGERRGACRGSGVGGRMWPQQRHPLPPRCARVASPLKGEEGL
jgi:hypothetical protein